MTATYRELTEWSSAYADAGWERKHFFPHRFYCVPKCGPDGYLLAQRMCGGRDPKRMWQITLFATGAALSGLPQELFFDRDIIWHEQHFNRPGQVATADLYGDGTTLYSMAHHSDLVQRISRRRELKTRVEKTFKGWHRLLLNCVANFALAQGYQRIRIPLSAFAMRNTDPKRFVHRELFERVYDRAVLHQFRASRAGEWWNIELKDNPNVIIEAQRASEAIDNSKTICIYHDIERGLGHRADSEIAREAEREGPTALRQMLAAEARAGVHATYNVVGSIFQEVRNQIASGGHGIAFHSYNHGRIRQLGACRQIDYRLKGYRPPRSQLTVDCSDRRLCRHNFEWLASSAPTLGFDEPRLHNHLVKIPTHIDDFRLYRDQMPFDQWRERVLSLVDHHDFISIGLHDCYARFWLDSYDHLLEQLQGRGRLATFDTVAAELYLAAAA